MRQVNMVEQYLTSSDGQLMYLDDVIQEESFCRLFRHPLQGMGKIEHLLQETLPAVFLQDFVHPHRVIRRNYDEIGQVSRRPYQGKSIL